MDYILYLFRSLYRVKWWILLGTLIISAIAYYLTGNMKGGYNVEANSLHQELCLAIVSKKILK